MANGMSGAGGLGVQPILILPEGAIRQTGREAQKANINAAIAISDAVKTTLGPRGMDKMLVDSVGDITITNDGATILKEMEIQHPAAKMMVEIAKSQEEEVGDGTTTAVVYAGEMLRRASDLMDQGIHPTTIIKGFRLAKDKAIELLNNLSEKVTIDDEEILIKIAETSMTGKGIEAAKSKLAKVVVDAIKSVAKEENGKIIIDTDDIKIEKKEGEKIEDTELVKGIVIDKEVMHGAMPKIVKNAKIALIESSLEVHKTETDAKIQITSPDQLQAFIDQEAKMLKEMVEYIKKAGANVVFCQKGIDDLAAHYLAKAGIMAVRRVKKSDMEKLAKATGANIISEVKEISEQDLGEAGLVEERKVGGEKMIFVKECKNPKSVTILVRGGTEHVVDEAKRGIEDGVLGIASALEYGGVVYGGGSIEVELARGIREYSEKVGGKEQLAINAFADALETIPRILAESAGKDAIEMLVNMKSEHEKGKKWIGVNVFKGELQDMKELGVVEPTKVKLQAISSATEVAEMILRIDDTIIAGKLEKSGGKGEGPSGGYEGGEY